MRTTKKNSKYISTKILSHNQKIFDTPRMWLNTNQVVVKMKAQMVQETTLFHLDHLKDLGLSYMQVYFCAAGEIER
jgi:hypothetical protein